MNFHAAGQSAQTPADTTTVDSVRVRFIPSIGKVLGLIDTTSSLYHDQFIWTDAKYLGDLLNRLPGWFVREFGEPGQPSQSWFLGSDWRGISFLVDGRALHDPVTSTFNLYDFPIEFVDHLEVLSAGEAIALGSNTTVPTINIVTRQYNAPRPITKIRFHQGPNEHLLTDALFTQNVATATNLMIGVQRQVTDGRFSNASYDSWSVRARVRYNVSEKVNLALTELYTKATTGANGGVFVDSTRSIFDERLATVHYANAREERSRHDLTFSLIAKPFADSLWLTQAALYSSTAERVFQDPGSTINQSVGTYRWSFLGGRVYQRLHHGFVTAFMGGQAEQRSISAFATFPARRMNQSSIFATAEATLLSHITLSGSAKQDFYDDANLLAFGGKMTFFASEYAHASAEYSKSSRYPSLFETLLLSPISSLPPFEKHRVTSLNLTIGSVRSSFMTTLTAFRRAIENAVMARPITSSGRYIFPQLETVRSITVQGLAVAVDVRVWKLRASGQGTYIKPYRTSSENFSLPTLTLSGELSFRDTFFQDNLDARLAFRARYAAKNRGMRFIPAYTMFVFNDRSEIGEFATFDLYGVFKIGDALINLVWENVPDINYITTPVYPMLGRSIRLGVNWVFFD
ncbi:MAG TPA: putative porin [Bacteroidota bacterium]|nr:putative porin [Bacteroidota bacterium]